MQVKEILRGSSRRSLPKPSASLAASAACGAISVSTENLRACLPLVLFSTLRSANAARSSACGVRQVSTVLQMAAKK